MEKDISKELQELQELQEAVDQIREGEYKIREGADRILNVLQNYKGTVIDAYREGLIRFNFPVPEDYRRHIIKQR